MAISIHEYTTSQAFAIICNPTCPVMTTTRMKRMSCKTQSVGRWPYIVECFVLLAFYEKCILLVTVWVWRWCCDAGGSYSCFDVIQNVQT